MRPDKRRISMIVLVCVGFVIASDSAQQSKTDVRGCIKTKQDSPAKNVEVRCFYVDQNEFPWQVDTQVTNDLGQYTFHVLSNRKYFIDAGGKKATVAQSKKFLAISNKEILVEDLVVTPATASLKGTILNSDGSPVSGLLYSCRSENFQLFHPFDYPQTNPSGDFYIPFVLENELVNFWVIPTPNDVQIWTGIKPDGTELLLHLNPERFLGLPPDWKAYHYIEGLARGMSRTQVRERIYFTVADLRGHQVSLDSDPFKGKVVLVNIFGSWCGSCNAEIPHLIHFKEKYEDHGLEIIGIAFERDSEEIAKGKVRELVEKREINYPVLFGGREKRVNVLSTIKGIDRFSGYPTTIFIGRDGKVKDVKVNFIAMTPEITKWQVEQFERIIIGLLKEPVVSK